MNIFISLFAGGISNIFYLIFSYFFDKKFTPKESNLISNTISVLLDIALQSYIFNKFHLLKNPRFLIKALIFEILAIFINQYIFNYVYKHNKYKLKSVYIRILTATLVFLIYTYPVRKYILFI